MYFKKKSIDSIGIKRMETPVLAENEHREV